MAASEELLSCGFVDRKENVVLYGGSGNGKTHTAVALGLIACSQGRRQGVFDSFYF